LRSLDTVPSGGPWLISFGYFLNGVSMIASGQVASIGPGSP
jgi:hypothetical protein